MTREEVDAIPGKVVLEFGTSWCPHCLEAAPRIARALAEHPGVRHIKIEDARGEPLGRSFRIHLWPTLVMLRDGKEVSRTVRPKSNLAVGRAFDALD